MQTDELFDYLFDGKPHLLAEPVAAWLENSRRFASFVSTFRDKIRKKLRVTRDEKTLFDLRLELETAYLLLREKNLSLAYEPEQSKLIRSPDFAVTYTTSFTFMVEVTRLRAAPKPASLSASISPNGERLADAICSKLGQCLSQRSNVLIVGMDEAQVMHHDLQASMLRIQQRAEQSDSVFWARYGFQDRSDFFRHYQRLSEVIIRRSQWQADEPLVSWINPQAKYPLPGKVRTALYRSHAPETGQPD